MFRYVIHWRSTFTGVTGHGTSPILMSSDKEAKRMCDEMDQECPGIRHWAVRA
jgi:hypothetical protein